MGGGRRNVNGAFLFAGDNRLAREDRPDGISRVSSAVTCSGTSPLFEKVVAIQKTLVMTPWSSGHLC